MWHSGCRTRVCHIKRWVPPLPPPEKSSSFASPPPPPPAAPAPGVTDEALDALLKKVWVESKRDPAKSLQPQQIEFVSRLESVCRLGQQQPNSAAVGQDPQRQWSTITGTTQNVGTWLAYDDPMQDVLSAFDRAQKQQQQQPNLESRAVAAADVPTNNSTRRKRSVKIWSLPPELRGPFPETCRPPHWDSLDYKWPREPGAPPAAAKTHRT